MSKPIPKDCRDQGTRARMDIQPEPFKGRTRPLADLFPEVEELQLEEIEITEIPYRTDR